MSNQKIIGISAYFFAFFWGILIILSLIGWGSILNRILFPKQQIDWGHKAAFGIAFSIVIGGILNLTRSISKPVIFIYLALGLFYFLGNLYQQRKIVLNALVHYLQKCRKDKLLLIGTLLILILILCRYAGSIVNYSFNPHDDYHAYFVFPHKMLEMGFIGSDPFSARRQSSLGGQAFLDTFVLAALSEKNLSLIDSGVGLIVAVGITLGLIQERKLSNRFCLLIILLLLVIRLGKVNITSVMVALALFTSLLRLLNYHRLKVDNFLASSFILALVTSAICTLKSNLIIPCFILVILTYFLDIFSAKTNKKKTIYECIITISLIIIFMLPWMISMYQSSGTLLYPFLGEGYHRSTYYDKNYLSPSSEVTIFKAFQIIGDAIINGIDLLCVLLLSFIIIRQQKQKLISAESPVPIIISSLLGTLILALAVGGHNIGKDGIACRYAISFVVPTLIILMTLALENTANDNQIEPLLFKPILITMFVVGLLFGSLSDKDIFQANLSNLRFGLSGNDLVVQKEEVKQYSKMLQVIPAKETILTRLKKPFLLDFSRNQIFLVDTPGESSLPPGMPFFKGSEALAKYLISKSIRYLAYSYASEAGFSKESYQWMLNPERSSAWYRNGARYTFDFQDNLKNLGKTRKRIYDDGENFVIDLQSLEKHQ
jgi:hypothetical protein